MNSLFKSYIMILVGVIIMPIISSMLFYRGFEIEENKEKIQELESKKPYINYEKVDKGSREIVVYNHKTKKNQNMDLEEYLYGVVSGEMPSSFDMEALKAQAVAARTYVLYKEKNEVSNVHKGAVVCTDFNHCQEYKSEDELKKLHGEEWIKNSYSKIKQAVDETKGHVITYEDDYILPLYFSTSSGKTENSEEVFTEEAPYLRSVESYYDSNSPKYESTFSVDKDSFVNTLKSNYKDISLSEKSLEKDISIENRSEGGSVEDIVVGNKTLKGRDLRSLFNLNSSNFDIDFNDYQVIFDVRGFGHGVGMSQWGADGMAKEGFYYYEILEHYYTGTVIKDIY